MIETKKKGLDLTEKLGLQKKKELCSFQTKKYKLGKKEISIFEPLGPNFYYSLAFLNLLKQQNSFKPDRFSGQKIYLILYTQY